MSYAIFRVQGVKTKGALRGLGKHHEDRISSTNNDIDPERKEANIELIGLDGKTYTEKFNDIVRPMKEEHEEHQKKQPPNRKKSFDQRIDQSNNDIAAEFLFTSDKEFFAGMTTEDIQKWGKESLNFVTEEIGLDKDKVIQAKIHMDEETPHLHVVAVPLVKAYDGRKKKDTWQISRKKFMPKREDMQRLQDKYHEKMNQAGYHLERGERKTGRKHLDVQQYKIQTNQELEQEKQQLLQEVETIKEENKSQHTRFVMATNAVEDNQKKKERINQEVEELQKQKKSLQEEIASAGEKTKSLQASFQSEKKELVEELNVLEQKKEQSRSERLQEEEKRQKAQKQVEEAESHFKALRERVGAKEPVDNMVMMKIPLSNSFKVDAKDVETLKEKAKAYEGERLQRMKAEKEKQEADKEKETANRMEIAHRRKMQEVLSNFHEAKEEAVQQTRKEKEEALKELKETKERMKEKQEEAEANEKKLRQELDTARRVHHVLEETFNRLRDILKDRYGMYITRYVAKTKEKLYQEMGIRKEDQSLSLLHESSKDYPFNLKGEKVGKTKSRDHGMER